MPVLPLPGASGLKAILRHRAKHELLASSDSCDSSVKKKDRDLEEFEFEPYGDNSRRRSPVDDDFDEEKCIFDDVTAIDMNGNVNASESEPSTSQALTVDTKCSSVFSNVNVITKGTGFMVISAVVDDVHYTGMLYAHSSDVTPGLLPKEDRKNFVQMCKNDKLDVPMDQWTSTLTNRQCLAGRQRRWTETNWAKKRGRMICYSCLCVVPEENSMPFACKCRIRQRQRALRLKNGAYLAPPKDNTVIVAQLDDHQQASTLTNGMDTHCTSPVRKTSMDECLPIAIHFHEELSGSGSVEKSSEAFVPPKLCARKASSAKQLGVKEVNRKPSVTKTNGNGEGGQSDVQTELSCSIPSASHSLQMSLSAPNSATSGADGATSTNADDDSSLYVIRNSNSPLQITIVKVSSSSVAVATNPLVSSSMKRHHHHHHRHRHHRHGGDNSHSRKRRPSVGENDNSYRCRRKSGESSCPSNNADFNSGETAVSESSVKSTEFHDNNRIVAFPPATPTSCKTANNRPNMMPFDSGDATNSTPAPVMAKRLSLESRISSIKQRLLLSAPTSDFSSLSNKNSSSNADEDYTGRGTHAKSSLRQSSQKPNKSSDDKGIVISNDGLQESCKSITNQEHSRFECGSLVWARAPPSAYWPGVIIEVRNDMAKVAWCGEKTYNEVHLSTVSDFMATLPARFSPTREHGRSKNKKFCGAIAEAIALARPAKTALDGRINMSVAMILINKFRYDLSGVRVFRGSKRILIAGGTEAVSNASVNDKNLVNQAVKRSKMMKVDTTDAEIGFSVSSTTPAAASMMMDEVSVRQATTIPDRLLNGSSNEQIEYDDGVEALSQPSNPETESSEELVVIKEEDEQFDY